MIRANIFYKFFQSKNNSNNSIIKYNSDEKSKLQNHLHIQIKEVDQQISENMSALFEAQIVKVRSTFSTSNNFIEKIGRNVYKTKLEESINWYQKQLKELYFKRKELQTSLEKSKGIFWINRIKRFLTIILIGFFICLSLFIFFSGFMVILYFMPLIILISIGYYITNKKH